MDVAVQDIEKQRAMDKKYLSMASIWATIALHKMIDMDIAVQDIEKQRSIDKKYLSMASIWSTNSYCKRLSVGALIVKDKMVISDGYNGTPSGFDNVCEDCEGKTHPFVLHAEANAITKLAKHGGRGSEGATLYCTHSPCIECAKLIIQAGIERVVYGNLYRDDAGLKLLENAGIKVERIDQ